MPPPSLNMPLPQPVHRPPAEAKQQPHRCPRCDSANTKFCYYNNYSLSQPRHFCKACKRYWTRGGTLRNVPVGGGSRKNKRVRKPPPPPPSSSSSTSIPSSSLNPPNSQIPGFPTLHTIMSPTNVPIPQTDEFGSLLAAPSELLPRECLQHYSLPYTTWPPLQQGGLDAYAAAIAQFEENKEGHMQQPSCGDYNNNHLLEPVAADAISPFWTSALSGSQSAAPSTGFFDFSPATHLV